jgi:hypothetical protein
MKIESSTRGISIGVVAIGAVTHMGLMWSAAGGASIGVLIFAAGVLVPWMFAVAAIKLAEGRRVAEVVTLTASVAYVVFGAWAFYDAMYVHRDAQGGLVFLVVPVAASFLAALLVLVLAATRRRGKSA